MKTSSSFPKAIDAQGLEVDYSEVPQRFCEAFIIVARKIIWLPREWTTQYTSEVLLLMCLLYADD